MKTYFWIEVKQAEQQFIEEGQIEALYNWMPEGGSYVNGHMHYVEIDIDLTPEQQQQIEEEGYILYPIPLSFELKNVRGIEWESFPDYGGWEPSDKEPEGDDDDPNYHEWVSYRAVAS